MSTPIEIVREQVAYLTNPAIYHFAEPEDKKRTAALAAVLEMAERYERLERAHAGHPWDEFTTIMITEYVHSKPGYEHVACSLAELADRLREGAT